MYLLAAVSKQEEEEEEEEEGRQLQEMTTNINNLNKNTQDKEGL